MTIKDTMPVDWIKSTRHHHYKPRAKSWRWKESTISTAKPFFASDSCPSKLKLGKRVRQFGKKN